MLLRRQGQLCMEEQVDEGVYELLSQRLGILELVLGLSRLGLGSLVEQHLVGDGSLARPLLATGPEELLLPAGKAVLFIDEGQDARQDTDAVQGIALRCEVGIGEGRVMT